MEKKSRFGHLCFTFEAPETVLKRDVFRDDSRSEEFSLAAFQWREKGKRPSHPMWSKKANPSCEKGIVEPGNPSVRGRLEIEA
jgi:hypothetical protein